MKTRTGAQSERGGFDGGRRRTALCSSIESGGRDGGRRRIREDPVFLLQYIVNSSADKC